MSCVIEAKDLVRFQIALGNIMRQQMDGLKTRERSKEERQKEREEKRKAKAASGVKKDSEEKKDVKANFPCLSALDRGPPPRSDERHGRHESAEDGDGTFAPLDGGQGAGTSGSGTQGPGGELPSHFSLEGPHLFWRAGSPEVKMAFLGTGGNFLLIGSKWNVVEDYVDLSHLTVSVLGNMVSLSGGQDTVLRIFCPEPESVQTFSEQIRAASYMRVSDEYLKGLQEHIKSRKKADKRRSWASAFGRWTEKICGARTGHAHAAQIFSWT
eukprot:g17340.t1